MHRLRASLGNRPPRSPLGRGFVLALAAALVLATAAPAGAALSVSERARRGVAYLASEQLPNGSIPAFSPIGSTADAVVSMVAAGVGRPNVDRALAYLERQVRRGNVAGVGLQAKVVLAAAAAGLDPRRFGGVNLVKAIRATEQADGRLGAGTAVFDHALGVLALIAAGRPPTGAALDWLADAQCADGGWQYDEPADAGDDVHCGDLADPSSDFFLSDTNTTGLAVMALEAGGGAVPPVDPEAFFDALRDPEHGGWGYTWGFQTTDANSTALVVQAYAAMGEALPDGSLRALRRLQYRGCGAWAYTWVPDGDGGVVRSGPNVGATIGAILGVLRQPLPVTGTVSGRAPELRACPG